MTSPTSVTAVQLEHNRDFARINRHAHEVKGTLNINMCKDAQLKLNTILVEALNCSPNLKKRKIEEAIGVSKDLGISIVKSKRNFQAGGFEMRTRANDNASYEAGNLNRCILNGKNPNSYKGIQNFDSEMISVYTRLNFGGHECPIPSPPAATTPATPSESTSTPTDNPSPPASEVTIATYTIIGGKVLDMTHPSSGAIFYSPHECKTLLQKIDGEYGKRAKSSAVKYMLQHNYVPVKKSAFYDKMKHDTSESTEWHNKGRPAKIDPEEVANYVFNMKDGPTNGNTMTSSDLHELIRSYHVKNCVERLKIKECDVKPLGQNTLYRVANKVRATDRFSIFKKVANKNETRYAAENSERSTIAYAMAVAASHFFEAPFRKEFHTPYEAMTSDSKLMYNLVKSQYKSDVSLVHVLPQLVTTTDELTVFATIGRINAKDDYYISIKPEPGTKLPASNTRSNYTTNKQGDRHCRGVRVVINNTFSASGQVAPIAATIYGLSRREMPGKEDIVAIPIPGLLRGADQNNHDETKGLLVFVRGNVDVENERFTEDEDDDDPDKQRFSKDARIAKLYREQIYYPFIERQRKWLGHCNEYNVPEYLRAVSWQDGCDGQLKLVTSEGSLDEDERRNITACKQSAARTTTEQSADVSSCFKTFRRLQKDMSVQDTIYCNKGLVRQIESAIRERETNNELILETFKFNAIVHLISKTPSCQSEAYTVDRIANGFIRNGQISTKHSPVPDIMGCLGTLRYEYPDQSEAHLQKIFNHFFPLMFDNGHIEESDYDSLDIRLDKDSRGQVVSKHSLTIRAENRQRAKIMSSKKQRALRLEEREKRKQDKERIQRKHYEDEARIFQRNNACEDLLMKHMMKGKPQDYIPSLGDAAESNFGAAAKSGVTPSKEMLISFIQVRSERHLLKNGGVKYRSKLLSKKRVQLVEECLKLKGSTVIDPFLKAPQEEEEELLHDDGVTLGVTL